MTLSSIRPSRAAALRCARHVLATATFACLATGSQAVEFETSGFGTLAVGRTFGGCVPMPGSIVERYGDECTRMIIDASHAGMYESHLSASPETRLGLQGTARLDSQFSLTAQITSRALSRQHLNLEWLYGEYRVTPKLTLQLGRKRLPLYYYSDFQDVGYAYETVRPSPLVYGWDVVNYNGASMSYNDSMGDWAVRTEVLVGRENSRKNPAQRMFWRTDQDVLWDNIGGVTASASRDWFTGSVSYVRASFRQSDVPTGTVVVEGGKKHEFFGLALNGDFGDWIFRSEAGMARRQSLDTVSKFYLVTLGYRLGQFTLTGGMSGYREKGFSAQDVHIDNRRPSLTLRYDAHKGGALKLQVERVQDRSPQAYQIGNANLVTAAYDFVF